MAQREQLIIFTNRTKQRLKIDQSWLDHGEWWSDAPPQAKGGGSNIPTWFNAPPSVIEPGQTVAWGSQSAGILPMGGGTGTAGGVDYEIPLGGEKLHIYWSVPFVGESRALSFAYKPPLVHFDFAAKQVGTVSSDTFVSQHVGAGAFGDSPFFNFGSSNPNPWDRFELVAVGSGADALTVSKPTKRVYEAVWRPGTDGEKQFYGLRPAEFQAKYDQLWKQGWRIHLLNTYVENGKRLYDAVWRPSTTGETQFYGLKPAELQAHYDQLWKQNWRIHLLNTYIENGQRLYDAVWRPGTTGETQFYGLKPADFQAKYDQLWKQHWRIHLLNTYVESGQRLYDAVWRPGTTAETQFYGLTQLEYQAKDDQLWKQGWRIHLLNTYLENGKRLHDAVWRPGTTGEMQFYDLNYNDLQSLYQDLWEKNWRIELLNTFEVPV